jgi:hypothetical protein
MGHLRSIRMGVFAPWFAAAALVLAAIPAIAGAVGNAPPSRPNKPVCPGPVVGAAGCHARVITNRSGTPLAGSGPSGYGPADFHSAYGLPNTAPTVQTIAIVDAYNDPTIESDLGVFSSTYGLPACTTANGCFLKVNQSGGTGSYPKTDAGWALEIALDVETAHAICQNCKILLVEATSNSLSNLAAGVDTAAGLGATEISNSYGGAEYSGETTNTSYQHPGIAITASAGDGGYAAEFPAASPYVVAVGGTTLNLGPSSSYGSETVWSGSGSGCSAYATAQPWQTSDPQWALTGCGTDRGVADVAADANPNTGASVYDTTKYQGQSGWFTVGGTSLSAPLIAAVYALAGGGSADYPAADPYAHQTDSPASLHDVTSGSNGTCGTSTMCKGAVGYDGPTGVGTPKGIAAFSQGGVDTTPPETTIDSGPAGATGDPTPTFGFSSSEPGSGFQCRLDTASFASCSSPLTTATLPDGPHSFEVRATDAAANTDPTPAQRAFTVDTAAPSSQAASAASANSTAIAVTYSAADGGSGLAAVELWAKAPGAGAYAKAATDSSPGASGSFSYTAAAGQGTYSFYTRALDNAANYEPAPSVPDSSTVLDTTPPETTIDSGPAGATGDPTPTFGFSSSEPGSGFQCRLDTASFASCSSPLTTATLPDGPHSFEVRATDAAANTDPTPAQRAFTVDTAAPSSQAASAASANSTAIAVTYSAADGGSGLAAVELWAKAPGAGAYAKAATDSSPGASGSFSYTAAAGQGTYSFYTRALDNAANYEPAPSVPDSSTVLEETVQPDIPPDTPPTETVPTLETVLPAADLAPASTAFGFDRIDHDGPANTAMLTVNAPGPGTLVLFGRKVMKARRTVAAAGSVSVTIRLKPEFRTGARGPGRVKVSVTYTPLDGAPATKILWLRLA